ncbi:MULTISPECIES: head maturation protease, ClpP-related [unclassified Fusobacterium]|nr:MULTISPECIES: head maturation protease, ClpP-related [unclassified Fusobacterium]
MNQKKKFWNLVKNEDGKTAEMTLYGSIGSDDFWDDITDKKFKSDIEGLGDVEEINLHINSPGGNAFAAVAIANTLKSHKANVTAYIDGLAASAATIITSACDNVKMPKNALFMIHNPWIFAAGSSQDLQKAADMLDKVKECIVATYTKKTGKTKDELSQLMDEETWMTAVEAKNNGFVDEILESDEDIKNVSNYLIVNNMAFDLSKFDNYKPEEPAPAPTQSQTDTITVDMLKDKYKDVYEAVKNEGVQAERNRLKAIDEINIKNHADLVFDAKYNSIQTIESLSVELVKLQQKENEEKAKMLGDDNLNFGMKDPKNENSQVNAIVAFMNKKLKEVK